MSSHLFRCDLPTFHFANEIGEEVFTTRLAFKPTVPLLARVFLCSNDKNGKPHRAT